MLKAKVRLIPSPPKRALLVLSYENPARAGDHVPELMKHDPVALEGFHESVPRKMESKGKPLEGASLIPEGHSWLLVEFGGDTQSEATERARSVKEAVERGDGPHLDVRLFEDDDEQADVWEIRKSGVGSSRLPGREDDSPSWEDTAVHPEKLGDYLREFIPLVEEFGYGWTLFGHFGQGCMHMRIAFDFKTAEGVRDFRSFMERGADLVVKYGGSISGEHGDGQARAELIPKMFGEKLMEAFREYKQIWDPDWKMNPGKVIDPYPLDTNLRTGPDYHPRQIETHFKFPDDHGSFAQATERCFGVGKCRRLEGGTMCPSFMVTREEKHTTRGRAHLLFELLRGEVISGWDQAVKESLDLCLACKGCKGDCPVSVDVATYKAEFLAHYYKYRPRPLAAYALGLVNRWAALGSKVPALANLLIESKPLAALAKELAGIAPEREIPRFPAETFTEWFRRRSDGGSDAGVNGDSDAEPVMLWPDTFNNYFHPETAKAAVEVLEAAGRRVVIPDATLCCGRPLYDYGMLDQAKRQLRQILDALRPSIQLGIPLVGLEPSCLAVFRDEMPNLLAGDEDARRLAKQCFTLSEYLSSLPGYEPPRLERTAIVQSHCHQKSVLGFGPDEELMKRMGLEIENPDSGCCGMAGSFGYEKEKYEVSMAIGERVILPAVRAAEKETLVIADGFSCRGQIGEGTDRRALHLAEVMQMALRSRPRGPSGEYPERQRRGEEPARDGLAKVAAGVALGAAVVAVGLILTRRRKRGRRRAERRI